MLREFLITSTGRATEGRRERTGEEEQRRGQASEQTFDGNKVDDASSGSHFVSQSVGRSEEEEREIRKEGRERKNSFSPR